MSGINKVILIGNLGADPELRFTADGTAVANLRIATSRKWKNKRNETEEETTWHSVTAWAKTAEICKEYLSKGRQVYIEGRLQNRTWTDKQGQKRYSTEVVAEQVHFLGGGGKHAAAPTEEPPPPDMTDDVPF